MRLHGTLFATEEGVRPLRAWAADADDEDRLTRIELRVIGNRVLALPVIEVEDTVVEATRTDEVMVPDVRRDRVDAEDFR